MPKNPAREKASIADKIGSSPVVPGSRPSYSVPGDGMIRKTEGSSEELRNAGRRYADALGGALGRGAVPTRGRLGRA